MNKDDNCFRLRRINLSYVFSFRRWTMLISIWICIGSLLSDASYAFLSTYSSSSSWIRMRSFYPLQQQESSSSSTDTSSSSTDYESLTVKELRELVRMHSQSEKKKGLLGKLKRKQEYVDYLIQRDKKQNNNSNTYTVVPTQAETNHNNSNSSNNPVIRLRQMNQINNHYKSPKQIILDQVYARYFPEVLEEKSESSLSSNPMASTAVPTTDSGNGEIEEEEEDDDEEDTSMLSTDIRQLYHPVLQGTRKSDMDLVFCGTASCMPSVTRGVSCTALRLNWKKSASTTSYSSSSQLNNNNKKKKKKSGSSTWLFDVGECTQLQIQKTCIKPSKITKLFLTHAHGDHSFGLPGLLCFMGQFERNPDDEDDIVDIYGPEGLRLWLRVAIRYSVSRIVPKYRVHELMDIPMAPPWEFHTRTRRFYYNARNHGKKKQWKPKGLAGEDPINWISQAQTLDMEPSELFGEVPGGRSIYPIYNHECSVDGAPVYEIHTADDDDVQVYAAPMSHGIPCVGYVICESPRPGKLRHEYVEPIVRRNAEALKAAGFAIPMKAMAVIKDLPPDSAFTFPDGTVVQQKDAVEPPRSGRKIVICGDTADSSALSKLAQNADVLVHEATNAYLPGVDNKMTSLVEVTRDAIIHGHSTPQIAGEFARRVSAKKLILNHFSARYKGDATPDSLSIMMRIEQQAMKASGLDESNVAAAWDMMVLPVPPQEVKSL